MNDIKIAAPMFILREQCAKGRMFEVLEKEKNMGFDGVELVGFWDKSPTALKEKLNELEFSPMGNHIGYPELETDPEGVLSRHLEAGFPYITIGGIPLPGQAGFETAAERINQLGPKFRESGITLLYHNHDFEIQKLPDGRWILDAILEAIDSTAMALEADLGWMQIAGADPDEFLIRYPDRIPVVHLKDFYASDPKAIHYTPDLEEHRGGAEHAHFEFRPLGYGLSDLPVLVPKALALNPDWVVVDHDLSYERNPYYDLQMSLDYLLNLLTDFC